MTTVLTTQSVLIGTAGHIDHGKTRLVARLTGIDTDRLPEEKARGISIDLGFAHWDAGGFRFGVVDVPGHERFVKNMVAGATGVDLALLVVAADDGVMPQTREHLDIMDLLGLRTGVVAVTKTDLVDPELVELVTAEIQELVAGTFLEGCPIVPVSSQNGDGLEELQAALLRTACEAEWPQTPHLFRMPIDRVFSISGHGTIVTGSVHSGEVHPGDSLELLPKQKLVRVRSVERHHVPAEESGARQRAAINLAGVKTEQIRRGDELATPGWLQPSRRLVVNVRNLASSPVELRDRMRLTLYLGTRETQTRLICRGGKLSPGEHGYAELRLDEPAVASYGQKFILRRMSPALTVAGGAILNPCVELGQRIKDLESYGRSLDTPVLIDRLSAMLAQRDAVGGSLLPAAWRIGIPANDYEPLVNQLERQSVLTRIANGDRVILIHRERLRRLEGVVLRAIGQELKKRQPRRALPKSTLATACRNITAPDVLDALFEVLIKKGELIRVGSNIGPARADVSLTKRQESLRSAMVQQIERDGVSPPTTKELSAQMAERPEQIHAILNLCAEDGLLVRVAENLYFATESLERARSICAGLLETAGQATASQLREAWGNSRKYAVPLCEFFDAHGVTTRQGDLRIAGPNLNVPIPQLLDHRPAP